MREAMIVSSVRTAVGKAFKGTLRASQPDDPAAHWNPPSTSISHWSLATRHQSLVTNHAQFPVDLSFPLRYARLQSPPRALQIALD